MAPAAHPIAQTDLPPMPSVAFGDGRRPEASTRVTLAAFDGPLALLLSLIEARQLDVLTVPLGALADAYLDALATLEGDRMGNVSAFVAVASTLILIKSQAMLPRPAIEGPGATADDGRDLEAELRARLILYRAFRDAGTRLLADAQTRIGLFHREPAAARAAGVSGARPPELEPLSAELLRGALEGIARIAPPPPRTPETLPRTITLGQRAALIRDALEGAPVVVLQDLLRGVRDRVVVAVTFLAMLELMKRREIVVEQGEPWGPISVRRTTVLERAAAGPSVDLEAPLDLGLETFT
jgi:segregation and condensation protein A